MEQDFLIVGFSKSKGFKPFSWLIRLFDGTKYSHAYIKVPNKHFNDFDIYQASKGMVNHIVESNFLQDNDAVAEFLVPIDKDTKMEVINYLRYKLGKPYSGKALIGIFLSRFGIKWSWFYTGEAYICSELVIRCLKESGLVSYEEDLDTATPCKLYTLCKQTFQRLL